MDPITNIEDYPFAIELAAALIESHIKVYNACPSASDQALAILVPLYEAACKTMSDCPDKRCKAFLEGAILWRASLAKYHLQAQMNAEELKRRAADLTATAKTAIEQISVTAKEYGENLSVLTDQLRGKVQEWKDKYMTAENEEMAAKRAAVGAWEANNLLREEVAALKSNPKNPANLRVHNSQLEHEVREAKNRLATLERENESMKKLVKAANNLKFENARLKKRLSQPELPVDAKDAISKAARVDGLEIRVNKGLDTIRRLEQSLTEVRAAKNSLLLLQEGHESQLEEQRSLLADVCSKFRNVHIDLQDQQTQLVAAKDNIARLENLAPHMNKPFVAAAVRTLRQLRADSVSTLDRIEQLKAGSRGDGWGLVEASQNVIKQALTAMSTSITSTLDNNYGARAIPLGSVLDPDDFSVFPETFFLIPEFDDGIASD